MKHLYPALFLAVAGFMSAASEAPRTPDHDELLRMAEQADNIMYEEIYRRRAANAGKPASCLPLPEIKANSVAEWEKERQEILRKFGEELYGPLPPAPDKIELVTLAEKDNALNGLALRREIRIILHKGDKKFDFDMLLYLPRNAGKPVPVFVGLNFSGNQYYGPETDIRQTRGPSWGKGRRYATALPSKTRGKAAAAWCYEDAVKRGYAVATACYGEIFPDNPDGFRKSIYTLFRDEKELRPDYEITLPELKKRARRQMSAISGWAWGLVQMRKALEQIEAVDAERAIAIGHSRLGKAALWAAANDPAFAGAISNNSGHLGASLSKWREGESIFLLWIANSHWGCENLSKYVENEAELPVDQHQLLALIAPRGLYVASSSEDEGAHPEGEFLSAKLAGKVWELYGKSALPGDRMPPENQPVGDTLRYHVKKGKHSITPWDWQQYYDFADALFGKTGPR